MKRATEDNNLHDISIDSVFHDGRYSITIKISGDGYESIRKLSVGVMEIIDVFREDTGN